MNDLYNAVAEHVFPACNLVFGNCQYGHENRFMQAVLQITSSALNQERAKSLLTVTHDTRPEEMQITGIFTAGRRRHICVHIISQYFLICARVQCACL